ncbi:DNA-J related domain-containing protein [Alteromonas sp. CYL-A6]|uniref:DNA-J related domain-containing protein n=1 Tax=Alteromonas nitratireducens TaxID=3390813 RepID=UPI0034B9941D
MIDSKTFSSLLADLLVTVPEWFDDGISEYVLIQRLQEPPFRLFEKDALRDPLVLFQTHFMLFHALYQVQTAWREDGTGELTIHTTRIALETSSMSGTTMPEAGDPLRDYYLNWDNYTGTGKDEVEALLDDFWRQFARGNHRIPAAETIQEAREIMELPAQGEIDKATLKRQYRRLQHRYHPDKGGDTEKAKQLVFAYTTLCRLC